MGKGVAEKILESLSSSALGGAVSSILLKHFNKRPSVRTCFANIMYEGDDTKYKGKKIPFIVYLGTEYKKESFKIVKKKNHMFTYYAVYLNALKVNYKITGMRLDRYPLAQNLLRSNQGWFERENFKIKIADLTFSADLVPIFAIIEYKDAYSIGRLNTPYDWDLLHRNPEKFYQHKCRDISGKNFSYVNFSNYIDTALEYIYDFVFSFGVELSLERGKK